MGMIDYDEMQLGALELEQFLQKVVGEIWITIQDNRVGNSMEFEYFVHENLSHGGCCE
jgi:hypothetical protein